MYDQIHRYHAERKSARWIADRLKINPRTVKKYLSMSQAEFERHSDNINRKGFKLERYTTFVVERLKKYQDTPAAQMHDLLKEHYPDFPAVSPKTVYNRLQLCDEDTSGTWSACSKRIGAAIQLHS